MRSVGHEPYRRPQIKLLTSALLKARSASRRAEPARRSGPASYRGQIHLRRLVAEVRRPRLSQGLGMGRTERSSRVSSKRSDQAVLGLRVDSTDASRSWPDLVAYEAIDGTWSAFVFGPAAATAHRGLDGLWLTPAPPVSPIELHQRYRRLDAHGAERLNWEAVHALTNPRRQDPRPTPAQLVVAARDYRRRCNEVAALRLAGWLLQRFTLRTRSDSSGSSAGPERDINETPDPNNR